jgi:hypothetical protein
MENKMRTLTQSEIQFAAGGSTAGFMTGVILTSIAIPFIIAGLNAPNYGYNCRWEPYLKEIRTPVYDGFGNHIGNQVDTYQDYRWTCI